MSLWKTILTVPRGGAILEAEPHKLAGIGRR
jgi:hypothetical protein